ncbi:hypothetical protein ACIOHE_15915 [Streptomyces sp. NPDC087851]|uniref:hypothetical protein n=1 Tax=Streptomyces sp. NPDC087851 TaxID=3365810 RepID=UPI0038123126
MVNDLPEMAIWDPDAVEIRVQGGTHPHDLIRELAVLLADLGAQPVHGAGLTCFCGMRVQLPPDEAELDRQPSMSGATTTS